MSNALDTIDPIARNGNWLQTYTGRKFWPMDPHRDDVDIQDIAHALSMQCRFAGHCLRFYSVAEHCVHLSNAVALEHALWALLHDASEAYLVDIPRPIKPFLDGYSAIEGYVMQAVCERFGLPMQMPDVVKIADGRILGDEREQNMLAPPGPWVDLGPTLGVTLQFWEPERAKYEFLEAFFRLSAKTSFPDASGAVR